MNNIEYNRYTGSHCSLPVYCVEITSLQEVIFLFTVYWSSPATTAFNCQGKAPQQNEG
jgi:hypothetical protein